MKRAIYLILFATTMILTSAIPSQAGGHFYFRGSVYLGPGWWGPPYPYYYPYYNLYYAEPPVIIERQAPTYSQPNHQQKEQDYWYYCPDPQGYYPYIKKCPAGWLKVVPSGPPDRDTLNEKGPSNYGPDKDDSPSPAIGDQGKGPSHYGADKDENPSPAMGDQRY